MRFAGNVPVSAFLLLTLTLCHAKNDNYQMSDICKRNYIQDMYRKIDGALLVSQNEKDLDCTITFQTHSILQRFMLRFDQLQLDCNDHLYIYDGAHAVSSYKICDKSKCPGPLRYYRELECKPIYRNPDDCCAEAFDCSHLEKLSRDKCYMNGHEYSIGEKLRDEDANPCDIGCTCTEGPENRAASFVCAAVDCGFVPPEENCFDRMSYSTCCPETRVCLKEGEKRATCEVDGKVYYDGHPFTPKSDPSLDCNCLPGYTGENVEPFCKSPNHRFCVPLFANAEEIHKKCAPVYHDDDNLQNECSYPTKCQNSDDSVVHNDDATSVSESDESKVCKLGNLTMHIGDTLNEWNTSDSDCIKCKCDVPPVPTCIQKTDCNTSTTPTPL